MNRNTIKVSSKLTLPNDVVTTATAVLGIRGSGKTNTGVVIVEDLLVAGHQVIVVDPLDVWWGLKSSADGKSDGYPITVIGGVHADVPLAEGDGKVLADFLVDHPVPAILSLRHLSKSAGRRFLMDFAEHLYHRKGESGKGTPVLMVVDEASMFCPQHVTGDVARLVGAIQSWVRQGRVAGIGCMLIDQRPATVNKDVLSQVELLVAHRLVAPQDRKALREWIDAHATAEQQKEFDATIATLNKGESWFWSPEWLNLFARVQVRRRRTFDSSATPKAGQSITAPKKAAEVDLAGLRAKLAATIEKARADDPNELRKKISELSKQLTALQNTPAPTEKAIEKKTVEKIVTDKQIVDLERLGAKYDKLVGKVAAVLTSLQERTREVQKLGDEIVVGARGIESAVRAAKQPIATPAVSQSVARRLAVQTAPRPTAVARTNESVAASGGLSSPEQRVLNAIAWMESIGVGEPERPAVAFLAGYTLNGSFFNAQGSLRSKGMVDYLDGDRVKLTEQGRQMAQPPASPATSEELHRIILSKLPSPEQRVLQPLLKSYPDSISNEVLSETAGYTLNGSYFNARGRLRSLGLVEYRDGGVVARSILFPN